MVAYDVANLISQAFTVNEIGDQIAAESSRTVYVTIDSLTTKRKVENLSAGTKPEIKFILSDVTEYDGEQIIEFRGKRYNVVSTGVKDDNKVEIVARVY